MAKHVLEGKTKGYKNHPQLDRFKKASEPLHCINHYLEQVHVESARRDYNFNSDKIEWGFQVGCLDVTQGQLEYEWTHLMNKLQTRDEDRFLRYRELEDIETHPLFRIVPGEVESWEVLK